jgi:hypothetical protein
MKITSKYSLIIATIGFLLVSCDHKLFITVGTGTGLSGDGISVVDFDFIEGSASGDEALYFQFVMSGELNELTAVNFLDKSGNVLAARNAGSAEPFVADDISLNTDRSYVYTIRIENLRSVALIHKVVIGDQ